MAEFESTSVETSEVAEPTEEVTGVEEQETAEPVSEKTVEPEETGKTEEDAAWARMRREAEQARKEAEAAQRELAELKARNEARESAYSRLTGNDNGEIAAIAEATGMSEDEVIAEIEAAQESAQKDLLIEQLQDRVTSIEAEKLMQEDLEKIRKVDPSLKSLEDLGEGYIEYISAGLDPVKAYWAIKAEERANEVTPPKEIGRVETSTAEKDYYTDAEIDAMSSEELTKNWKKVMASWDRHNK
jgi:hypothetical protein